ncbi:transporter substrate-binding domain-containing protein [Shewanella eurypsychrophilus]|uniref:Transporter substrate-binding domain-containing protein n=1 Tax=Shewanella eurypsychrophilus TaxID=2593656 RepID=A0ABX6VF73_9GAMM|nr:MULTISPECIES: transporter substrate-binding domain-containing protein [Shewanella]QFU24940.1 transporter substrate-binding domain-containing protein [Shewanella sp. YLB-09]QPG60122.1 transporter substrate-binding domain-containing protein [Shewanella eurypsychrophilus]
MRAFFILAMIASFYTVSAPAETVTSSIVVQPKQSKNDASYQYYIDLVRLVLRETQTQYGNAELVEAESSYTQSRAFIALKTNRLDLYWAGTNKQREQEFRAIRMPLMGGLLGVRVPVIRAVKYQMFLQIGTSGQLKVLTACQGDQWPDSDILQENGYRVERVTQFALMYSMLKQGRCDYFPRGITEVYAELEGEDKEDLIAFDKVLLSYPFPMYFFVNKENSALAERLEQGLLSLISQGKLKKFMQQHPVTKNIFPLEKYSNSKMFSLINSSLPESTPIADESLWLQIKTSRD